RTNEGGTKFWVHRYSDAVGRRQQTYLGTNDDRAVLDRLKSLRKRIEEATVDRKTYSTLASLHDHALYRAGAVLIGSHALGTVLETGAATTGSDWACSGRLENAAHSMAVMTSAAARLTRRLAFMMALLWRNLVVTIRVQC